MISPRPLLACLLASALVAAALLVAAPAVAVTTPSADRVAGSDRYDTSVKLADSHYPSHADIVFIATGTNYPDALAAGAVAAKKGGPLLLTAPTSLPSSVKTELVHLNPAKVVVVGGTAAVSATVVSQIHAALPAVTPLRIAGTDRYDTGRQVVNYAFGAHSTNTVFVATGTNFPDALSAAAAAGANGYPVLLVNGGASSLDSATKNEIARLGATRTITVGGTAAVSAGIQSGLAALPGVTEPERVAGTDRFDTSVKLGGSLFDHPSVAYLATGYGFPDALAGSAIAGVVGAPLFTVQPTCVPQETLDAMRALGVTTVHLIGGTSTLSSAVASLTPCPAPAPSLVKILSTTAPVPSGTSRPWTFGQTACADASTCIVGGSVTVSGGRRPAILTRSSSGALSAQVPPLPVSASTVNGGIFAVSSCGAPGSCVAGGSYTTTTNDNGQLMLDLLKNGHWSSVAVPLPSGSTGVIGGGINGISCVSATFCAISAIWVNSAAYHSYTIIYNGSSWTATAIAPAAGESQPTINDVSCASATDCVATVNYYATTGDSGFETWNGSAWTASVAPVAAGTDGDLEFIDCDSTGVCAAGGTSNQKLARVAIRTGGTWHASVLSHPSSAIRSVTTGVSCDAGRCALVGYTYNSATTDHPVTQFWNGSAWVSQTPAAVPSGLILRDQAVSCYSATQCVAMGRAESEDASQGVGAVQTWNGTAWTGSTFTDPSASVYGGAGVSCVSTGLCVGAWETVRVIP